MALVLWVLLAVLLLGIVIASFVAGWLRRERHALLGGRLDFDRRVWRGLSVGAAVLLIAQIGLQTLAGLPVPLFFAHAAAGSYCLSGSTSLTGCMSTGAGISVNTSTGTLYAKPATPMTIPTTSLPAGTKCLTLTTNGSTTKFSDGSGNNLSLTFSAATSEGVQTVSVSAFSSSGSQLCSGNTLATATATDTVDATGPSVTPTVIPTPNTRGWDNANITVSFACADARSGVQTCPAAQNVTSEGPTTVSYTATDNVGNTTAGSVGVKLDKTNPTISGSAAPAANAHGWNNGTVTVTFACNDPNGANNTAGSGIVSCAGSSTSPGSTQMTAQGKNQSATGTATDAAGNSATATVNNINIDEAPPAVTGALTTSPSGTDGQGKSWYQSDVAVQWTACDALSGVDPSTLATGGAFVSGSVATSCPAGTTGYNFAGKITGEGKGLTTTASASDLASNPSATATSPAVNIDRTPPITTLVAAPPVWSNTSVTLTFQASDSGSGVAGTFSTVDGGSMAQGSSTVVSGEGIHTVLYWSEDYAGNFEAAHSVQVKIDQTAPTIGYAAAPVANSADWNNSAVTVTFTCSDQPNPVTHAPASGIASCDGTQNTTNAATIQGSSAATAEGTTAVTGTATDTAGNSASATDNINIDETAPRITLTPDRPADNNGWYNHPVTFTAACADPVNASNQSGGSGIPAGACPAPATLTTDGANLTVSASVSDAAGNPASARVSGINLDQAPPVLTAVPATAPNANGWYTGDVGIVWMACDGLSGVDPTTIPSGATAATTCPAGTSGYTWSTTITGEGRNLTIPASASDRAGNSSGAVNSPAVNIDRHAPVTTIQSITAASFVAADGTHWYGGPVTIALASSDNLSDVATTYITVDGTTATGSGVTVGGAGAHMVTFWSVDKAGNVEDKAQPANRVAFSIDLNVPLIAGAPTTSPNANNWYNAAVTVRFTCSDAESGMQSCDGSAGASGTTTLSGEGFNQHATGIALDNVGNSASATVDSINIDLTRPTLSGAVMTPSSGTAADGTVWYKGDVAIAWTCTDPPLADGNPGSGAPNCPGNSLITGEGRGLTTSQSVSDLAGNSSGPVSSPAVNIDRTAPTITGAPTTAPSGTDASGAPWYKGDVAIAWTCTDPPLGDNKPGSGVEHCPGNSTVTGEGAGLTATVNAADVAGNSASGIAIVNIDRTAPITSLTAPVPDWTNKNVTLTLSAADSGGSGLKATYYTVDGVSQTTYDPAAGLLVSGEGVHTVRYWSADYAGNLEQTQTATVKIDQTAPVITVQSHVPAANGARWNNTTVTVTFACTDPNLADGTPGSGIATCDGAAAATGATVVSDEGATTVNGTATDNAGNSASTTENVNIDETPPRIAGAITTASSGKDPSNTVWYNTTVTVHYTCADPANATNNSVASGIASCPDDQNISTEGRDQSASGTATDAAGNNSAPATVGGINVDHTAPQISGAITTAQSGPGWYNTDVTVHWTCADPALPGGADGSGVVACPGDSTLSSDAGGHPFQGPDGSVSAAVGDYAGNSATGLVSGIHVDRTPPQTSATVPTPDYTSPDGMTWYGGPGRGGQVSVTLTATDGLSGVASTTFAIDGGASQAGTSVLVKGEGVHTLAFWSVDVAGNAEAHQSIKIYIDTTPPDIHFTRTPANGNGWNNGPVTVTFACGDPNLADGTPGSGVDTCLGDTTLKGEGQGQVVVGNATDHVGNASSLSVTGINIDLMPPTMYGVPATAPNSNGWYNADVTIQWYPSDNLSGIDPNTDPHSSTINHEGKGVTTTAAVSDLAGNSSGPVSSPPINLDKTAPVLTPKITSGGNPDPHGVIWYNGDVVVQWTACDALSGVDTSTIPASAQANPPGPCYQWSETVTGEGATLSSQATASDLAGNQGNGAENDIHIDRTPPVTTLTSPVPNWANKNVTLTLSAQDTLSGVAATFYQVDGVSQATYDPAAGLLVSGEGVHTVRYWSVDYAGNTENTNTATVKIDQTAPVITVQSHLPAANGAGWNKSTVTVTFTCTDPALSDGNAGSGVATCDGTTNSGNAATVQGSSTVTAEGATPVTGTATDNAGNSASTTENVSIDETAPQISISSPPANSNGWYNSDVTFTFSCADPANGNGTPGSGIPANTCPKPITLSEGAGQSVSGTVADTAGNTKSASLADINIDEGKPALTGTITTTPSGTDAHNAVWYNTDVNVHWDCSDPALKDGKPGSGIDGACPTDSTVGAQGGEGTGLSATQSASDRAGNSTTTIVGGINIDRTAPATTAQLPPTVYGDWYNGPVSVSLSPTDAGSGVATTYYTVDQVQGSGKTFSVSGNGTHTITYWSVDYAGNKESAHSQTVKIDTVAPTLTSQVTPAAPNASGWYNQPVTVAFTCADDESGVASCLAGGATGNSATLSGDGKNQSVTGVGVDNVGNHASATVSGINIDRTTPMLTVTVGGSSFTAGGGTNLTTQADTIGSPYTLGGVPTPACGATDNLSGFGGAPTCAGSLSGGQANGVGTITYTATATDLAGNTTRITVTFHVSYGFIGFLPPISAPGHQIPGTSSSSFKGGSTVPVKFQLTLANGTVIQAGGTPLWVDPLNAGPASSGPSAGSAGAPVTTSNGGAFSWDASGQQYIYTWKTASMQAGAYWRIGVKLDDGTVHLVYILLRS